MYVVLERSEKYRLHTRDDEDVKNLVPKGEVVKGVLFQQLVQAFVAALLFTVTGNDEGTGTASGQQSSIFITARQFFIAMLVLDTWQYSVHRYMHVNKFLYRHFHSQHHRLIVPYAYGALYNHPVEGLLLDTVEGAQSFLASGMTPRTSFYFYFFLIRLHKNS
ncbi:hypothetical protein QQ045_031763 [Rhodiola kirilowii]